jgi:hypothetical protein
MDSDVSTLAFWNIAVADKDLPDDLVYRLVKATFQNREAMIRIDPTAAQMLPENIRFSTVPLHPGALKYYREIGIEIPAHLIP